jgi:hypothetical protein
MEREARAAAALSHPHLVTVHDFGHDEAGPFLVMELVEGPSLATVANEVGPGAAVAIGACLAEALAVIHEAGIIHRDVKPSNVLMSERGPLLTDFGIAVDAAATSRLTEPGTVVGTPSYAAPEVLEGGAPTPASDVFSLAVLVYELVAGRRPFPDHERAQAPPRLADIDLDRVLRSALSPEPAHRPSAKELATALRAVAPTTVAQRGSTLVMSPAPTVPITTGAGKEPPGPRRRNKVLMASAAVLVALAVAAFNLGNGSAVGGPEGATTVPGPPATVSPVTVTTDPTVTVTTAPTTTTSLPTVEEASERLQAALAALDRSDLKPRDARDINRRVEEAIRAADEGDLEVAGKKLGEVRDRLGKLEPSLVAEVVAALDDLARALFGEGE